MMLLNLIVPSIKVKHKFIFSCIFFFYSNIQIIFVYTIVNFSVRDNTLPVFVIEKTS